MYNATAHMCTQRWNHTIFYTRAERPSKMTAKGNVCIAGERTDTHTHAPNMYVKRKGNERLRAIWALDWARWSVGLSTKETSAHAYTHTADRRKKRVEYVISCLCQSRFDLNEFDFVAIAGVADGRLCLFNVPFNYLFARLQQNAGFVSFSLHSAPMFVSFIRNRHRDQRTQRLRQS